MRRQHGMIKKMYDRAPRPSPKVTMSSLTRQSSSVTRGYTQKVPTSMGTERCPSPIHAFDALMMLRLCKIVGDRFAHPRRVSERVVKLLVKRA